MDNRVLVKKYKLLEPLASGGMATVYLAKNLVNDEIVVAKIPNFAGLPNREKLEKRFMREAQILSKISSRYVVKIHDFGQEEMTGEYFLILEYLHGKTLEEIAAAKERIPVPTVVDLSIQLAQVLADLYEQGIVHRDVKSSNIKITADGNIKLFDFGISKGQDLPSMTRATDFLGTLQYMSPEQTDGREVDIRSDIYSFGIVLFEMLFGRLPFDAPSPVEVIEMQRHKNPKIPQEARERGISSILLSLMLRCLEKKPEDRFQTPHELVNALKSVSDEIGMNETERDNLRRTRLTSIASRLPVPTYKVRARKKQTAIIASIIALFLAVGGSLLFLKGCLAPQEAEFQVAQGEIAAYQVNLNPQPGSEQLKASVAEVPKGLTLTIEKTEQNNAGSNNANLWILSFYSGLTTALDIYPVTVKMQHLKQEVDSDGKSILRMVAEEDWKFWVEVVKGRVGQKAIKLIGKDQVTQDPNAKVENAIEIDGKIYVPVNTIAEGTQAKTDWNREEGKLTYITPSKTVELEAGKSSVKVNGSEKQIPDAPVQVNDSLLVTGNVAESTMDAQVDVNKNTGEVNVAFKEPENGSKVTFKTIGEDKKEITNASVFLNDGFKGKTPLTIELPNGSYNVIIILNSYNTVKGKIDLISAVTTEQTYTLIPATLAPPDKPDAILKKGTLKLTVNVPWGMFIVDGISYTKSKEIRLELEEGRHYVIYKLAGFPDQTATIIINAGQVSSHSFRLNSGILILTSNIPAVVYIDSNPWDENMVIGPTSPWQREVAVKTYKITVTKSLYKSQTKTVSIEAGKTNRIYFELQKK